MDTQEISTPLDLFRAILRVVGHNDEEAETIAQAFWQQVSLITTADIALSQEVKTIDVTRVLTALAEGSSLDTLSETDTASLEAIQSKVQQATHDVMQYYFSTLHNDLSDEQKQSIARLAQQATLKG